MSETPDDGIRRSATTCLSGQIVSIVLHGSYDCRSRCGGHRSGHADPGVRHQPVSVSHLARGCGDGSAVPRVRLVRRRCGRPSQPADGHPVCAGRCCTCFGEHSGGAGARCVDGMARGRRIDVHRNVFRVVRRRCFRSAACSGRSAEDTGRQQRAVDVQHADRCCLSGDCRRACGLDRPGLRIGC